MISVTGATSRYILQPSLMDMHNESIELKSSCELWKKEIAFFQKLLDKYAASFAALDDKKRVDHFQNLIIYYGGELIPELHDKLRAHEMHLARSLRELNESDTVYFTEHKEVIEELTSFARSVEQFRAEFYAFIEEALR
ncbi:MAG: hypothetical protein AB7K37_16710 [Cyclobacteriaceae bacterium]